tara:strand:+ start:281 stop:457 length:177 start_codon:yes stop_codon:yes gene_type:complete
MLSHVFRATGFVFAFFFEAVELLDEEADEVAVYLSIFRWKTRHCALELPCGQNNTYNF